jgi:hypothetical protein
MKKLKIEIKLYKYDELSGDSKEKAFDSEYQFLLENPQEYEDNEGNMQYDNMEEWTEKDIREYVEECININEYLYFKNGVMADITYFTGNHEKAGQVELKIAGNVYTI